MLSVGSIDCYYGAAQILHGVSLDVEAGEVVALLGRNGAGKSTLMKAIIGIVPPRAGRISLRREEIGGKPPFAIARMGVGFVPEERRIFTSLTVEENLAVGRRAAPTGVEPWTPERLFAIFPNLAEMRRRRAAHMSGGEQQMLTIARSLMGNPTILLLDEPSEGLAPKIVEQVAQAIADIRAGGVTVLISEQNMHFAALVATRAYVIEKGQMRFSGTFEALRVDDEVRRNYLAV